MTDSVTEAETHHGEGEHHPTPAAYVKVAAVLAVVTAIEVAFYYITGIPDGLLSASLLIMMVIKFALVGLWFMHLRFDSVMFRRFFVTGIVLALAIYTIVLLTFGLLLGG